MYNRRAVQNVQQNSITFQNQHEANVHPIALPSPSPTRRVSFTEPSLSRTDLYPLGLRKARAPAINDRRQSDPGPGKCSLLDLAFADESRAVDADTFAELQIGDAFFDHTALVFFGCAITLQISCMLNKNHLFAKIIALILAWSCASFGSIDA